MLRASRQTDTNVSLYQNLTYSYSSSSSSHSDTGDATIPIEKKKKKTNLRGFLQSRKVLFFVSFFLSKNLFDKTLVLFFYSFPSSSSSFLPNFCALLAEEEKEEEPDRRKIMDHHAVFLLQPLNCAEESSRGWLTWPTEPTNNSSVQQHISLPLNGTSQKNKTRVLMLF